MGTGVQSVGDIEFHQSKDTDNGRRERERHEGGLGSTGTVYRCCSLALALKPAGLISSPNCVWSIHAALEQRRTS